MSNALENMKLRAAYRLKDDNETAKKYWDNYKKQFRWSEPEIIEDVHEDEEGVIEDE